jgi:hypothetical protein
MQPNSIALTTDHEAGAHSRVASLAPGGGPQPHCPLCPHPEKKKAAEKLARAINDTLGWRGANPEWTHGGYTGGVVLSQRAAVELTTMALLHQLDAPVTVAVLDVPRPHGGLWL